MTYKNILITGGCGFVGSNIATSLKSKFKDVNVIALDNFYRKGSEMNISRLEEMGVVIKKGDVRVRDDLIFDSQIDLIIDCAAEPSVLAGVGDSPLYSVDTNLMGTINCLELARKDKSSVIFISTSRVYPIKELSEIIFDEEETRFSISAKNNLIGVSKIGISEDFPLGKIRTLYGSTKLASEYIIYEYSNNYSIPTVINRCGVITGPWQFGKVDQGFVSLWVGAHVFDRKLSYIGFGGNGKQVRDFLHVDDLIGALILQIDSLDKWRGEVFNIGGGYESSVSLQELTNICSQLSGRKILIDRVKQNRVGDIPLYITDYSKFSKISGWRPKKKPEETVSDIFNWIRENQLKLQDLFN